MTIRRWTMTLAAVLVCVSASAQMTFEPGKGWSNEQTARGDSTFKTDAGEYYQALAFYQGGHVAQTIALCQRIEKVYIDGPWVEKAMLLRARARFNQGNISKADKTLTALHKRFPATTLTREMSDLKLAIGIAYAEQGKYAGARILQELIEENPYGPRADEAQFKIARLYENRNDYYEAAQAYELVVATYKDSVYREESLFLKAKMTCLQNEGPQRNPLPYREAWEGLDFYLGQHPQGKFAAEAKALRAEIDAALAQKTFLVADYYQRRRQFRAAQKYFGLVVKDHPETTWARQALTRLAEVDKKVKPLAPAGPAAPAPAESPVPAEEKHETN